MLHNMARVWRQTFHKSLVLVFHFKRTLSTFPYKCTNNRKIWASTKQFYRLTVNMNINNYPLLMANTLWEKIAKCWSTGNYCWPRQFLSGCWRDLETRNCSQFHVWHEIFKWEGGQVSPGQKGLGNMCLGSQSNYWDPVQSFQVETYKQRRYKQYTLVSTKPCYIIKSWSNIFY